MSIQKFNPRFILLVIFIVAIGALRILAVTGKDVSPLSNFTPIGAMALFGGAYFTGRFKSFAFPLLTLFISDMILSFTVFSQFRSGLLYGGWYWTYGAFALMVLAGKLILKDVTIKNVLSATLASVFIHWIVSDIGVWIGGTTYAKTIPGLIQCLVAAIPYEGRFLAGTLMYSTIMFSAFEFIQKKYPSLKIA